MEADWLMFSFFAGALLLEVELPDHVRPYPEFDPELAAAQESYWREVWGAGEDANEDEDEEENAEHVDEAHRQGRLQIRQAVASMTSQVLISVFLSDSFWPR